MTQVVGIIAMGATLLLSVTAVPSQVYKNYKNKEVKGISLWLGFVATLSYSAWCLYGYLLADSYLFWGQLPGTIFCWIGWGQYFYYEIYKKSVND